MYWSASSSQCRDYLDALIATGWTPDEWTAATLTDRPDQVLVAREWSREQLRDVDVLSERPAGAVTTAGVGAVAGPSGRVPCWATTPSASSPSFLGAKPDG
jgi:hypothetical protein